MDPLLVTLVAIIATPITAVLCAWLGFALGRKSRPECECRRYVGAATCTPSSRLAQPPRRT